MQKENKTNKLYKCQILTRNLKHVTDITKFLNRTYVLECVIYL